MALVFFSNCSLKFRSDVLDQFELMTCCLEVESFQILSPHTEFDLHFHGFFAGAQQPPASKLKTEL
jgi:hypothetical protein